MAKKRSQIEIVNDINHDLVSLYRYAQWHLDALINEVDFTLSSRENLKAFHDNKGITELQRAARFLIGNRISFGGGGLDASFAVARTSGGGASTSRVAVLDRLRQLNARLDRVVVECLTWSRCLELYDGAETFFFIDPPYLHAPTKAYDGFNEAQMTELRDMLVKLKGNWLLTVDASDFNKRLFARFKITETEIKNQGGNCGKNPKLKLKELFITPR